MASFHTLFPHSSQSRSFSLFSVYVICRQSVPHVPNGTHQAVYEEFVLLRRCLFSRVPHLAVAALHEPLLEVDRVCNVRVCGERVGGEGEGLERGVEVGNAVLCEQADEVQAAEWELAGRRGEDGAVALRLVRIFGGKAVRAHL